MRTKHWLGQIDSSKNESGNPHYLPDDSTVSPSPTTSFQPDNMGLLSHVHVEKLATIYEGDGLVKFIL